MMTIRGSIRMKENVVKRALLIALVIYLVLSSVTLIYGTPLKIDGYREDCSFAGGKVAACNITFRQVDGGPGIMEIHVGYPAGSTIMIRGKLTTKEGPCIIEFLKSNEPSVVLTAKSGTSAQAGGEVTVKAGERIAYRITATRADNVKLILEIQGGSTSKRAPSQGEKDTTLTAPSRPASGNKVIVQGTITYPDGSPVVGRTFYLVEVDTKRGGQVLLQINKDGSKGIASATTDDRGYFKAGAKRSDIRGADAKYTLIAYPRNNSKSIPYSIITKKGNHFWFSINNETEMFDFDKAGGAVFNYKKELDVVDTKNIPFERYVTSLKFFESGYDLIPYKQRIYQTRFEQEKTRYINWQLNLKHPRPGERIDCEINWVWKKSDGSVYTRETSKRYMDAKWGQPWISDSWGNREPGVAWKAGKYTLELFIDRRKIAEGAIEVHSGGAVKKLAPVLDRSMPKREDAIVLESDDCPAQAMLCHAVLELRGSKKEVFNFYKNMLIKDGWLFDKGLSASDESGALKEKPMWGFLNFIKDKHALTLIILSDQKSGSNKTRVDINLINQSANEGMSDFLQKIPKLQKTNSQMNRRSEAGKWAITPLLAYKSEGISVSNCSVPPCKNYSYIGSKSNVVLFILNLDLERLDQKLIKDSFISVPLRLKDTAGNSYAPVATALAWGDYYDYSMGGSQSMNRIQSTGGSRSPFVSSQLKERVEYIFAVPSKAVITELIWPGLSPIRLPASGK